MSKRRSQVPMPDAPLVVSELDPAMARRLALRASGAAGVHDDQKARKNGAVGRTQRVGSRASRKRVAIEDQ